MKSTKTQVTLNEFEAMALHKHYRQMAKDYMAKNYQEKGFLSIVDEYYLMADKWLDVAFEIAREKNSKTFK